MLAATEDRQEETRLPNEERYVDKGLTGTSVQLKERVINHHEAPGKYQLQKSFYPSYAVVSSFFFKTGALPLRGLFKTFVEVCPALALGDGRSRVRI